jgi:AI-2 transport protein TqsA
MAAPIVPLRPLAVMAAYSIVAAVAIGFLYYGSALLIPLAIAILIWHLINALAGFYHHLMPARRRLPGWLCYMAALLTMFGGLTIMVELIMDNVAQVSQAAPGYEASLRDLLNAMYDLVGLKTAPTFAQLLEQISVAGVVTSVAGTLGGLAGSAGIVIVYVIFLLLEQSIFERKLHALLADPGRAERLRHLFARISRQIEGYLWVKTLTSLLTGVVSFAIMWGVGVDFAAFCSTTSRSSAPCSPWCSPRCWRSCSSRRWGRFW